MKSLLENAISGRTVRTSHAHVVDQLGRAIIAGEFSVGETLPGDTELEERFQVSRTVVREAMKTLSAKGLIVSRARVGTRVTERKRWNLLDADILSWHLDQGINEGFLSHLSEVRLAIEPYAAGLAAQNATGSDIENLRMLAEAMGDANHSAETLAVADLKFHLAIAEASHNPFMRSISSLIEAALVGVFKISSPAENPQKIKAGSLSHLDIVEAIANHDASAAEAAMKSVIIEGVNRVLAALQRQI
ncbi:FadR family transcriptional regulator [Paraburkholderia aspalathi]|nr:FadR family transcriptional regulator [Paraburkholderia aspalathi]